MINGVGPPYPAGARADAMSTEPVHRDPPSPSTQVRERVVREPADPRTGVRGRAVPGPRPSPGDARACAVPIDRLGVRGIGVRGTGIRRRGGKCGRPSIGPRNARAVNPCGGMRVGMTNGVPGAGRRRRYVSPGYQACTSIRLSGTSPARRASRGWSRVGTRQPYPDARSVPPFYARCMPLGTPGVKTFTIARAADCGNAAKYGTRLDERSADRAAYKVRSGGRLPRLDDFATVLPCSGEVLKAFF